MFNQLKLNMNLSILKIGRAAFAVMIICGALATNTTAQAQSLDASPQESFESFKKPMPEIDGVEQARWEADSTLHEVSEDDSALAYKVRLPKSWTPYGDYKVEESMIQPRIFTEIAQYVSPPDILSPRSRFSVNVMALEYKLSAEQWFLQYLLAQNYKIEGFKTIDEDTTEALYVLMERDDTYIVRAVAKIAGDKAILAAYHMPIEKWGQGKPAQVSVMSSFALLGKVYEPIEEMKTYAFLDLAEMSYPESWTLRSRPLKSLDRLAAQILRYYQPNERKPAILNGRIDVSLVSVFDAGTIEEELELLKAEMKQQGFIFGEALDPPGGFEFDEGFDDPRVKVFKLKRAGYDAVAYEFWITQMMAGDYHYFLTLLTSSRENDYDLWARNSQTFKLVNENFTLIGEEEFFE